MNAVSAVSCCVVKLCLHSPKEKHVFSILYESKIYIIIHYIIH